VVYVLTTPIPKLLEDATVEAIRIKAKWENDDCICRGHILNGMSDSLFDVYTNVKSDKELWDSLESKYTAEDSSSKKFLKCDKTGHFKRDCRSGNKKNTNAGGSGKGSKDHSQDQAPYTPQQNGVAKRKNKALKERVNSMLSYSGLSKGFWGEAMLTAYYLLNRVPNKRNKTTPYELCIEEDPRTYDEAMQSQDAAFWKEAIDDEIGHIMENNTWFLSDLPPGCKPLGCKWIFKRKLKVDGTIGKFKARLEIQ
nr:zinc finger, CCHC-type [Tanacetum cinerariifolium]